MKKKLLRGILIGGVVLLAVFAFVYHLPLDRSGTYTLTVLNKPEDGTAIHETAEMEITLHRFFFRPTLVRGTIKLGEQVYVDAQTKWSRAYASYSFTDNLRRKADGSLNAWFIREEVLLAADYMNDSFTLASEDSETFTLYHIADNSVVYRAERVE